MKRREFLNLTAKSLSFMALADLIKINNAFAEDGADQFFVQVILPGGWDTTLGVEPWLKAKPDDAEMFIEYDPSNITRKGSIAFGPAFLPMAEFSDNMTVINGIFLSASDNGHDAAMRYMQSGSVNSMWGSLPVEYSECRGEEFLGILANDQVLVGSRSPVTTPLASLGSLNLAQPSGFNSGSARKSRLDVVAENMQEQRNKFGRRKEILDYFSAKDPYVTEKHHMAAAMSAGLSTSALFQATGGLDTHSAHKGNHLNTQTTMWEEVKTLLKVFQNTPHGNQGKSLYDHTTFFITSEFSRTAALNTAGGKDHNPLTNSVVIISPNVRSTTIGGSHLIERARSARGLSYHIASPIDYQTGQAVENRESAFIIRPENIAATVAEIMGVSRKRFAPVSAKVASLTHLIRR